MIDPNSHKQLKEEIAQRMVEDRAILDELREEIRPLRDRVRRIQRRTTTAISLVGTDGGNNRLQFDPFLVQLIRVVDSSNNAYCLDAVTPTTNVALLSERQFDDEGRPQTPLGEMMEHLGVYHLAQLSSMIPASDGKSPVSPSWVQVYRELVEWATLFHVLRTKQFGSDTLIVYDGLLRSKVFAKDLFARFREGVVEGIEHHRLQRRKVFITGMAKHSKVLTRYRLAMALEHILDCDYPAYVEVPRDIEAKAYVWTEYARDDRELSQGEANKFVGGKMFFVKFGSGRHDPIWPVDILLEQVDEAAIIMGYLLEDAISGFPVPHYPRCLQKAHENAAIVDFDLDVLQDQIFEALRLALGDDGPALDVFRLHDADPAQKRYD